MVWKLNGVKIDNDPCKLPAIVLEALPDLKFRSTEALQELYRVVTELSLEMAKVEREDKKGGERAALTRYINRNEKNTKLPNSRRRLLEAFYEKILVAEGLGRLHGFGFSNRWGDKLRGNSEYESIKHRIYPKQDLRKMEESIMKRSALVKAAKELNEVLGLDPQINTKEKPEKLIVLIKEAAKLVDPELDDLTDDTLSVIAGVTKEKKEVKNEKDSQKDESVDDKKEGVQEEKKESTDKKDSSKGRRFGERTLFLLSLLEEGKYSRKEMIEKGMKEFPSSSRDAWGTMITDSKNPKYNKFDKLVKQRKDGTLSF